MSSFTQLFGGGIAPNFAILTASGSWTCPPNVFSVWVTLIGGGGASQSNVYGGGGGQYIDYPVNTIPETVYNITIGIGGTYANNNSVNTYNGNNSTAFGLTAYGGGGVAFSGTSGGNGGYPNGSGGGAGSSYTAGGTNSKNYGTGGGLSVYSGGFFTANNGPGASLVPPYGMGGSSNSNGNNGVCIIKWW